jgi:CRISPR/Cas system CMR-associated protein Cmr5 small subunit
VLDLTGLTQAQLYLYLATLRNLREDTGFVRTTIYFADRCKMNFYAAYVLASRIAITTIGHHTITVCRNYSTALQVIDPKTGKRKKVKTKLSSIEAITADMIWMMGLQRLAENPKKHDKYLAHQCTHSFSCASLISKISNIHAEINIYEALDPDIVKAIMATDDTTSQKYVTEFLEKRPRIKYKRAPKKKEATGEE